MPINAYTGLMGSGKSYESVVSVIIPAIAAGRTVVTNVDGIDGDAIRAYCVETMGRDLQALGNVVHCKNEDVHKPDFLPHGTPVDTFCKAGDMVVIDEAWRFWGTDCKLLSEHKIFFREHRHYVNEETKVSCDLVLMVQDINDLHRILKVVVEVSFRTTKIKSLGLNKVYRVEMWEGYKQSQRAKIATSNKTYDKDIFPLYSSYSGGQGKEVQVDSRQNILNNKTLWFLAVLLIVLVSGSSYLISQFFKPETHIKAGNAKAAQGTQGTQTANASGQVNSNAPAGNTVASAAFSDKWRYAGQYTNREGQLRAIVVDGQGRIRVESPSVFTDKDYTALGYVDNQRVTVWTGQETRQAQSVTESKK
ncbi:zonular occludens toxin domain-containing protein [Undibacterium sp. Ji83W]|uniref:zonular occludens toxin domain-containing protein n=1 Tax=Undibacterium sp. Ji83W TaxID=3413043 RepID=UPI003BF1EE53